MNDVSTPRQIRVEELFDDGNELLIRQPHGWYVLRRYADGTLTLQKKNASPRRRVCRLPDGR